MSGHGTFAGSQVAHFAAIPEACLLKMAVLKLNPSYCDQADPDASEMTRVSAALPKSIADHTQTSVVLLHFDGDPKNPVLGMLSSRVTRLSALPKDFDAVIRDDILGFDSHPGPFWHYAISRKLIQHFAR
jgi:hypothetical protein